MYWIEYIIKNHCDILKYTKNWPTVLLILQHCWLSFMRQRKVCFRVCVSVKVGMVLSLLLKLRMPSPVQLDEQLPSAFELFDGDERRRWRRKGKEEPMLMRERPLLLSGWKLTELGEDLNWIYFVARSEKYDDSAIGSCWANEDIFALLWTDKTVRHRCCEMFYLTRIHILCVSIKIKLCVWSLNPNSFLPCQNQETQQDI